MVPSCLLATSTYLSACVCTGHKYKLGQKETAPGSRALHVLCTNWKTIPQSLSSWTNSTFPVPRGRFAFSYQRNPNFCRRSACPPLTHPRLCLAKAQSGLRGGRTPHPKLREQWNVRLSRVAHGDPFFHMSWEQTLGFDPRWELQGSRVWCSLQNSRIWIVKQWKSWL